MNSRTAWLRCNAKRGIVDHLAQHRPGVGHDGHAVLAKLGDEPLRLQSARQRDPGAADDGPAQAHQQPGLVMQRSQAVDRVAAAQRGGRGRSERRQRPAVVGDLLGHQLPADRAERDEREVTGEAGVRPVPPRQRHGVRVDLLHVDDAAVGGHVEVAGLAAAEDEDLHRQFAGGLQVARIGDHLGDTAEPDGLVEVGVRAASAPRRRRVATARRWPPAPTGRVSISTPTRTPWRTPTRIRPRTTLLMRRLTPS